MCGIAGIVKLDGLNESDRHLGLAMAGGLSHRGPDDHGSYDDAFASLGHARLSIIDLTGGRQPMTNEDRSIWVVFNGEIYNHRELATRLVQQGHELRTRSDTEVLVHLYEEHGDDFVDYLNGMFAIAIWDTRRRRLVLARDRLGIKPLYWYHGRRTLVFASELKSVLQSGAVEGRIDDYALIDYLTFGHIPAPRTIWESVNKLEPGTIAVCDKTGVHRRRYWDIPVAEAGGGSVGEKEWIDQFESLFEDAVRARMIADVPLGAFLSSGIDSTLVSATMRGVSQGRLITNTVGFAENGFDEREGARAVARQLGTDHREVLVHPDAVGAVRRLVHHFDEPFADSSSVPMLYLSREARRNVKVALSGDGGDEMLAGYRRYRFDLNEQLIRSCLPGQLRRAGFGLAGSLYPKADWLPRPLRAKRTLQNIARDPITAHLRSTALMAGELPKQLLHGECLSHLRDYDPFDPARELFHRYQSPTLLNRLLYVDMKTLMVDDILTKVDRTSMAVGLEVRVPLLDHRLVELAARMPTSLKLRGRLGKRVLREMVARKLGSDFARRNKRGFNVPTDQWLRGPLYEMVNDTLGSNGSYCRQWIEPRAIEHLIAQHKRGARANGHVLWTLLCLEQWARAYTGPVPRSGQRLNETTSWLQRAFRHLAPPEVAARGGLACT